MDNTTSPVKYWLRKTGRTAKWLSREVGVTEAHMSRIINGKAIPPKSLQIAIAHVSEGGIPADAWVPE